MWGGFRSGRCDGLTQLLHSQGVDVIMTCTGFYEFRKHLHNITEHPELKWPIFIRGGSLTPTPIRNRVKNA